MRLREGEWGPKKRQESRKLKGFEQVKHKVLCFNYKFKLFLKRGSEGWLKGQILTLI